MSLGINNSNYKEHKHLYYNSVWLGSYGELDSEGNETLPLHVCDNLVLKYTKPGELIFDPFFGNGTFGRSSLNNGRLFLGIEIDDYKFSSVNSSLGDNKNCRVVHGDSTKVDIINYIKYFDVEKASISVLHPPPFSPIKRKVLDESVVPSDRNLSYLSDINEYIKAFRLVVESCVEFTEDYIIVIVDDIEHNGEILRMSSKLLDIICKYGFRLVGNVIRVIPDSLSKRSKMKYLINNSYFSDYSYIFIVKSID